MTALEHLQQLRERHAEAARAVQAAEAELNASARWYPAAQAELAAYLDAVENGQREPNAAVAAGLRARVTDLGAYRVERDRRGPTSVRYADKRAVGHHQDALDNAQLAQGAIHDFIRSERGTLEAEMLEAAEQARDRLLIAADAASSALAEWRQQRQRWLELGEVWVSPAETPPLPVQGIGRDVIEEALLDQQRAGGHIRHPRLPTPAPVSVQLADPSDAMRQLPGDQVPPEQRADAVLTEVA